MVQRAIKRRRVVLATYGDWGVAAKAFHVIVFTAICGLTAPIWIARFPHAMFELLKELLHRLSDVRALVALGGMVMVCGIVFVETGLFVGFFLPGDSLLVTAGIVAADKASGLQLAWLLPLVTLCAISGDQLGYLIGRTMGPRLYQREDSRFFKKSHLLRAHEFYEKHGARTVILSRLFSHTL